MHKNVSVWVCVLKFGIMWENNGVLVHTLNLDTVQENDGVRVCPLNFSVVRKNNNGACGVHNIGIVQRSLVRVRAMWVYVVARKFSEWCNTKYWCAVGHTKIWHGATRRVKGTQNINTWYKNCARWILACDTKVVHSYWRDREVIHNGFKVREAQFTLCCCCAW
jgi:hypothetical protein